MRPLWRDVVSVFRGYFDAPNAMDASSPATPEDYREWAEFEKLNFQNANTNGVMLATIDYILTHPEFSITDFVGEVNAPFIDEAEIRRTLEIAREVAFPEAPPVPVPEVEGFDPTGLLDKTPARGAVVGPP